MANSTLTRHTEHRESVIRYSQLLKEISRNVRQENMKEARRGATTLYWTAQEAAMNSSFGVYRVNIGMEDTIAVIGFFVGLRTLPVHMVSSYSGGGNGNKVVMGFISHRRIKKAQKIGYSVQKSFY